MNKTAKNIRYEPEIVAIDTLRPHPRNYREHPDDQLDHIAQSLDDHGFYKNVVTARDYTILAGHGVVKGARRKGLQAVPVIRLDLDPDEPRALKILAGDNEIPNLAEADDRLLSEMLREINEADDLLGTGFDEMMLANFLMVTRPASEIQGFDEAAEWVGMPEYEPSTEPLKIIVSFRSEEDRDKFIEHLELDRLKKASGARTLSTWWPPKEVEDPRALKFVVETETP